MLRSVCPYQGYQTSPNACVGFKRPRISLQPLPLPAPEWDTYPPTPPLAFCYILRTTNRRYPSKHLSSDGHNVKATKARRRRGDNSPGPNSFRGLFPCKLGGAGKAWERCCPELVAGTSPGNLSHWVNHPFSSKNLAGTTKNLVPLACPQSLNWFELKGHIPGTFQNGAYPLV